jgi:hypothetical protein
MGLDLRLNLFRDVACRDVYSALAAFYGKRGGRLESVADQSRRYDLYERDGAWCVLTWDSGWEWKIRREAQLFASKLLRCVGLLVFVYDGDYWGYELFRGGEALDRFIQHPDGDPWLFPGESCVGNAEILAENVPERTAAELAPYLVRASWEQRSALNVRARPEDQFPRFHECAVWDFLRAIGVPLTAAGQKSDESCGAELSGCLWRSFGVSFASDR